MVAKPSFQGIKETMLGNYHRALKSMGHVANWWLLVFSNYFMERICTHKMWYLESCFAHTGVQLLLRGPGQEAGHLYI